jgi:hypothetical protein
VFFWWNRREANSYIETEEMTERKKKKKKKKSSGVISIFKCVNLCADARLKEPKNNSLSLPNNLFFSLDLSIHYSLFYNLPIYYTTVGHHRVSCEEEKKNHFVSVQINKQKNSL